MRTTTGTLQFFGPAAVYDLEDSDTLSFSLAVSSFDTVSSPGELSAELVFAGSPVEGRPRLEFTLDLSGLNFDETRQFSFRLADIPFNPGSGTVTREDFLRSSTFTPRFDFDAPNSALTDASALLDDFIIVAAPPPDGSPDTDGATAGVPVLPGVFLWLLAGLLMVGAGFSQRRC